ncbi:MAG: ABC transporter ATP-binding protein [Candidatus Saccharimonadales bacterium]
MIRDLNTLIDVSNVSQTFNIGDEQVNVLNNVNLKIMPKTLNIIYGQSGSGKSTLINILTGLQKPSTGRVVVNGRALYELEPDELAYFRANDIGIVYQQDYWVKSLTVAENVSMPLYFSGHSRSSAMGLVMNALDKVGMADYAKKYPTMLSGGEQKRIVLARAIVNDPHIIVADEPTGSLDSTNGDNVINLLYRFQSLLGRTIILVTHNMEYIPLADHLFNIHDGLIVETANSADISRTADKLMQDMKKRIDTITKARLHDKGKR